MTSQILAVLFDLDGTLIDSAPDLAGTANDMRNARGLAPLSLEYLRPMVGAGARGLIGRAFNIDPEHASFVELRDEFLRRYEPRLTHETRLFPQIQALLDALAVRCLAWGIVTNKASRFAEPLVRSLGLLPTAATLVCGDTTPHAKPHPAPLLEAARRLGVPVTACVYVGDDLRDVQAGRAAGMATIAACWGYLGVGEPVESWRADYLARTPADISKLLGLA